MALLQARVDVAVIALWLGHTDMRSTDAYIHADLSIKERALALTTPASVKAGRYKPRDSVLASSKACNYADQCYGCQPKKPAPTRLSCASAHCHRHSYLLGIGRPQ